MHLDMPMTFTDTDGRFRFPHVRPAALVVQVKVRGHAPERREADASVGNVSVAIKLGPPHALVGRVVNPDGKSIPDAILAVNDWRGYRFTLDIQLKTDSCGRFRWDDAPVDPVTFSVSRPGFRSKASTIASANQEVSVVLTPTLSISGKVRDGKTNEPIEFAIVEVGYPDAASRGFKWYTDRGAAVYRGHLQAEIDVDGETQMRLRISAPRYARFGSRTFRKRGASG